MTDSRGGYPCPYCDADPFVVQSLLNLHIRRDHPEETA